jgi:hypothetical protein
VGTRRPQSRRNKLLHGTTILQSEWKKALILKVRDFISTVITIYHLELIYQ